MGDIDLTNADSRMAYLKENLGHLMNGIDSNYGQVLMDELMRRMETTVSEFNEEVKAMLGQLQGIKPTPRDNILKSAPQVERQAPQVAKAPPIAKAAPEPRVAPAAKVAPEPPTTELKPAPEPVKTNVAPELPEFDVDKDEPDTFVDDLKVAGSENIKEVEIEVDLDDEALSDFEKKLRALSR